MKNFLQLLSNGAIIMLYSIIVWPLCAVAKSFIVAIDSMTEGN